jgi:hypothetical protein
MSTADSPEPRRHAGEHDDLHRPASCIQDRTHALQSVLVAVPEGIVDDQRRAAIGGHQRCTGDARQDAEFLPLSSLTALPGRLQPRIRRRVLLEEGGGSKRVAVRMQRRTVASDRQPPWRVIARSWAPPAGAAEARPLRSE